MRKRERIAETTRGIRCTATSTTAFAGTIGWKRQRQTETDVQFIREKLL